MDLTASLNIIDKTENTCIQSKLNRDTDSGLNFFTQTCMIYATIKNIKEKFKNLRPLKKETETFFCKF